MLYALWDTQAINLVASYDNQRDALALVLRGIERNGPHATLALDVDVEDDQGEVTPIAHGAALAELARRELAAEHVAS